MNPKKLSSRMMDEIERIERAHQVAGAPLLQRLQRRMRTEVKVTEIPSNVRALLTNPKRRSWLLLHDVLYIYALQLVEPLFASQQKRLTKLWQDYDAIVESLKFASKPDRSTLADTKLKMDKLGKLLDTIERVEQGLRKGTDLMALALMFRLLPIVRKAGSDDRFWRRAAKTAEKGRNLAFDETDVDCGGVVSTKKGSASAAIVLKAAMTLEGANRASLKSVANRRRESQTKLR